VLCHLDGRHTREEIAALVADWCRRNQPAVVPRQRIETYVDRLLPTFARAALLVG
jgi:predicted nucleotidyltransferase